MTDRELIPPRWLKLKAAAKYGSIREHRVIELAKAGVVNGCQDPDSKRRDWIFDRLMIDEYREGQMSGSTIHERVLESLRSLEEGGRARRKRS